MCMENIFVSGTPYTVVIDKLVFKKCYGSNVIVDNSDFFSYQRYVF